MVKAEIFGPGDYDTCVNQVKRHTGILLIFHPGCGHCVQMRPEWEAMKQRLSPMTKIIEIDGSAMSEHPAMNKSAVIQRTRGFPSIFKVKHGKVIAEYQGPRTMNEMKQFVEPKKSTRKRKRKGKPKKTKRRKP
jgi:thioredoxin-like negative regulator of GroEL